MTAQVHPSRAEPQRVRVSAGTCRRRPAGFTLIELLIAVAIVAILMTVALPAFQDSLRKSRRSDAINAISAVQQAQERVRANWTSYCGTIGPPAAGACGLGLSSNSPNDHYTLVVSGPSGSAYTVTATAVGGQAADSRCAVMAARMQDGGTLEYGSGSPTPDWTDANRCWAK